MKVGAHFTKYCKKLIFNKYIVKYQGFNWE